MKNYLFFSFLLLAACQPDKPAYLVIGGETMGTYFKVTYQDSLNRNFQLPVDSLLKAINQEISTYIPTSTVSQFNQADSIFELGMSLALYEGCKTNPEHCTGLKNKHFYANLLAAKWAWETTAHAFDPTVMPLVNYWGFGYTPQKAVEKLDSFKVDSLLQFVGFQKLEILFRDGNAFLKKPVKGIQLDFGGTGQGYAIDEIAVFLEQRGIENYLVDIGGECRARGVNEKGKHWRIGINTPKPEAEVTDFTQLVELENLSLSSSGNYRKFHEVEGRKYSHFINPATGFPEMKNLLSASVFAKDCLTADALATGFMVLGLEKASALAEELPDVEALFIFSDEQGKLQVKRTSGAPEGELDNSQQ